MITAKTIGIAKLTENGQIDHSVKTEYEGSIKDLTIEFLALLEDGLNNPDIRTAFNTAFRIFNNKHPLNSEVNNG